MKTNGELLRIAISKCTPGEGLELWEIGPYLEAIAAEYDKARARLPADVETELAAIEARANKATPGPWYVEEGRRGVWLTVDETDRTGVITASMYPGEEGKVFARDDDFEFITHARTDVPRLVDIVRAKAAAYNYQDALNRDMNRKVISLMNDNNILRDRLAEYESGHPHWRCTNPQCSALNRCHVERCMACGTECLELPHLRARLAKLEEGISTVAVALGNTGAKDSNRIEDALTLLHGLRVEANDK